MFRTRKQTNILSKFRITIFSRLLHIWIEFETIKIIYRSRKLYIAPKHGQVQSNMGTILVLINNGARCSTMLDVHSLWLITQISWNPVIPYSWDIWWEWNGFLYSTSLFVTVHCLEYLLLRVFLILSNLFECLLVMLFILSFFSSFPSCLAHLPNMEVWRKMIQLTHAAWTNAVYIKSIFHYLCFGMSRVAEGLGSKRQLWNLHLDAI